MNHAKRYGWVQSRLKRWGQWRTSQVVGLGYPSMTADARLRLSPGRSTKPHMGPDYRPDPDSEDLDDMIERLIPKLQLALWCRYVQDVKTARALVICEVESRTDYYGLLEQAERDLAALIRQCA